MDVTFYKYHGAGNDFILVDNRNQNINPNNTAQIKLLCDRHFGIGADGLMLIENSEVADFEMLYFNADGNLGSLCGNGSRCAVQFCVDLGIVKSETITFLASDGLHQAKIPGEGQVSISMRDLGIPEKHFQGWFLNTGSPHLVCLTNKNLDKMDVYNLGRELRHSNKYKPSGTNVNFVEVLENNKLRIRTFERGVEQETLACGTGVTAVAAVHAYRNELMGNQLIDIEALGGHLNVSFSHESDGFKNVWLTGPAKFVFRGIVEI